MRKIKSVLYTVVLAWIPISCLFSQTSEMPTPDRYMNIGERLPEAAWEIPLQSVTHSGHQVIRLEQFRGKVILLDFWSTGCSGCVDALPKLDQLQQNLSDELVIIPISKEKSDRMQQFLQTNQKAKELTMSLVVEDTYFNNLFDYQSISHVVWIDQEGVFRATSYTNHVTDRNVRKMITRPEQLDWRMKYDNISFRTEPIVELNREANVLPFNEKRTLYYSAITGYTEGLHYSAVKTSKQDSLRGIERKSFRNRSIFELYRLGIDRAYGPLNVIWEVRNPAVFDYYHPAADGMRDTMSRDEWHWNHAISYESTVPLGTSLDAVKKNLLTDLNRFLTLDGRLENRDTTCLALVRTDTTIQLAYSGKERINTLMEVGTDKRFKGYKLNYLVNHINSSPWAYPLVVDETKLDETVDLHLQIEDMADLASLRQALRSQGLDLIEVNRNVEFFVLTEK